MKSKYKHINPIKKKKVIFWMAHFYKTSTERNSKTYKTEREAALAVDLFRINIGKDPVNILVKK